MEREKHTILPIMSVIDQIMSDDCHDTVLKQLDRVHLIVKVYKLVTYECLGQDAHYGTTVLVRR